MVFPPPPPGGIERTVMSHSGCLRRPGLCRAAGIGEDHLGKLDAHTNVARTFPLVTAAALMRRVISAPA